LGRKPGAPPPAPAAPARAAPTPAAAARPAPSKPPLPPAAAKKAKSKAAVTMADVDPELITRAEELWSKLDRLDYFQVLRLQQQAAPADIKKAYHRDSREFHPDRFFKLDNVEFRDHVDDIYKRINEAYVTLRDDRKRAIYIQDISGPERAARLRWAERTEAEIKAVARKEVEEQVGTTPQGRKFYELGMKDFQAGNFQSAERNFKMALTFEPANAKYKDKMKEAGNNIKMDFRIK
jgi:DnaJ-class molecular chaperone